MNSITLVMSIVKEKPDGWRTQTKGDLPTFFITNAPLMCPMDLALDLVLNKPGGAPILSPILEAMTQKFRVVRAHIW